MKRTLLLLFACLPLAAAAQSHNPCVWGPWNPSTYPHLNASAITLNPTNPQSCGSVSLQLTASVTAGVRVSQDNCANTSYDTWPGIAAVQWSYAFTNVDGFGLPAQPCGSTLDPLQPGTYTVIATVTGTATNPAWTATLTRTNTFEAACSTNGCPSRLWPFDDTNAWLGAQAQVPLSFSNIFGVPSWSSNAVRVDSTSAAALVYPVVETNGTANLTCRQGAVRFWFRPGWDSASAGGNGPGDAGRFLEVGRQTPTNGWWGLLVSTNGNQLLFGTQTNGLAQTNLAAAISWSSNQWYQVVLCYTPTNSALYTNGQLAASGSGVTYFPNASERAAGLKIGSDGGTNQARGTFEELETFPCPLDAASVQANYESPDRDTDGNGLPDSWERQYFGHTGVDPNADPDHDGLSNLQEYLLASNPTQTAVADTGGRTGLEVFTPLKQ